jgi:hypothetical protein
MKNWFKIRKTKNMTPTLSQIVAAAQALTSQILAYAASIGTTTGPVPSNVQSALTAVTAASTQLNTDLASTAGAFTLGQPSPTVILTDVANLLTAVQALSTAVTSPSNP